MTRYLPFVALVTAALTTSVSADHIVDEHIKAVGGSDAISKVKTLERSGTVGLTGPFGEFQGTLTEEYDIAGDKGHNVMDLALFVLESAWIGDEGWQDRPPQGISDMPKQALDVAKLTSVPCPVAAVKAMDGMEAFGEPSDETFNEKECVKVPVSKYELALYFDKETKLLAGVEVGEQVTMTFEDYKETEGIQFAGKSTTTIAQGDITMVSEYTETKLNGELDDSVFAKPEPIEAGE